LDGTVIGHLDGFSFTPDGMDNRYLHSGGPLVLGHADHFATLSAPADNRRLADTPDPPGSVPLTGGAVLVPVTVGRSACLRRADGVVSRLEPGAIDVSADGQWVTTRQVGGNSYTSGTAYNVTSSDVVRFDSDCFIGNDSPVGRVDICGDTLRINRATGSPLDVMTPGGHHLWTAAAVSPDGKTVLAQRSAECESQSAWLVPLDKPDPTPQLAGPPGTEWDSAGMGWLDDGHAIISYGPGICGTALPAGPGVYSLDPRYGSLRPIYPVPADISAWGALLWNDG
jgi:hypothetical protein